ncbi:MAG: HD domain-containing protein, partial [Candidatus Krumholzibacteria bacterium]|nr:HD domain-containing protein [Candidatus Krumholzibacteria bacterium]
MQDWHVVFPELDWISDAKLREQVISVWNEAFKRGGWKDGELDLIPFTLLVSDSGVTLAEHTRIVTNLCRNIAGIMKEIGGVSLNDDYLVAGALLHDVGKLLEYRKTEEGVKVSRSGRYLRHP